MRGFTRALFISVLVHGLVVALVYAIPLNHPSKLDTVLMDFTVIDSDNLPEGLGSGPGILPKPPTMAAGVSQARRGIGTRDGQKSATEPRTEVLERRDERSPVADPAQGEDLTLAAAPDLRQEPAFSSPDGVPVAGLPGGGNKGSAGQGSGRDNMASIGRGGAGGGAVDAGGGGHAAILRQIRDSVMKNVTYPEKARRMGWEGKVIVSFTVYEDGSIHEARVMQSSGSYVLDEAAKEALAKSSIQAQFARKVQVILPIEYMLR